VDDSLSELEVLESKDEYI